MDTNADSNDTPTRKRRRYSQALKQEVVEATLCGKESVSVIARRYDINANVVFRWRKLYRDGDWPAPQETGASLVPVNIVADAPSSDGPHSVPVQLQVGTVELSLPNGTQIQIHGSACPDTLRIVLESLKR